MRNFIYATKGIDVKKKSKHLRKFYKKLQETNAAVRGMYCPLIISVVTTISLFIG